jgi:hypothetical protein
LFFHSTNIFSSAGLIPVLTYTKFQPEKYWCYGQDCFLQKEGSFEGWFAGVVPAYHANASHD